MSGNFLKKFIKFPTSNPLRMADPGPQTITIPRINDFCNKILKMKQQTDDIEIISDYDYTLTKFKANGEKCDSLFGMWVKNQALPQKFRVDLLNNYLLYGPYETDGSITFAEKYQLINQLYYVQTKLFESHRITERMALHTLENSNVVFRAFTKRLFQVTNEVEMPFYIISGGISDIVYTSIHDLAGRVHPNISIHSNQFERYIKFGESTDLIRFKKPIIHSYNKYKVMKENNRRKNCILMGDLESDIYMARSAQYETILSIFYAKEGETDQRAFAEDKFDIIIEGDASHKLLVELIKIIHGKKNINWEYLTSVHKTLYRYLF